MKIIKAIFSKAIYDATYGNDEAEVIERTTIRSKSTKRSTARNIMKQTAVAEQFKAGLIYFLRPSFCGTG